MPKKEKILVVDDEKGVRNLLHAMLETQGYEPLCLEDAEKALELLPLEPFGLVITDLRLPGMSGERFLERVKSLKPSLPVVVISAYGNTKNVVEVIKKGAEDYLAKPFDPEDLEVVVLKALKKHRLLVENERLRQDAAGVAGPMVGRSKAVERVLQLIQKFASSDSNVLITGESGVGKELAAKAIHELSSRAKGPLVQVNAGSLPASLFEAELFGVKKGAYTGASETREGLFQASDGGTLFLDEIAEVQLESQAKLLRVLESGEVRALGDSKAKKFNVRMVAATNQNIGEMVEQKRFRQDLFYRLSVLLLPIPPLRERREDIPLLADHFLGRFTQNGASPKKLSADALKRLMTQTWPGNVRELKNVLERAALLANGEEIKKEDISFSVESESGLSHGLFRQAKRDHLQSFEKKYLHDILEDCEGNVSEASRRSGLTRRNLQLLLKKYRLNPWMFKKNK